jgi:hypothetical protein
VIGRASSADDPRDITYVNGAKYKAFPHHVVLQMILDLGTGTTPHRTEERWARYWRYLIRRGWL